VKTSLQALGAALALFGTRAALGCPFCGDAAGSGEHDSDLVGTLLVVGAGLFVLRAIRRRLAVRAKAAAEGAAPTVDGTHECGLWCGRGTRR
jgi:hypothetical protein